MILLLIAYNLIEIFRTKITVKIIIKINLYSYQYVICVFIFLLCKAIRIYIYIYIINYEHNTDDKANDKLSKNHILNNNFNLHKKYVNLFSNCKSES
jgi:hypothetical protein